MMNTTETTFSNWTMMLQRVTADTDNNESTTTSSTPTVQVVWWQYEVAETLWKVVPLVILALGTVGNVLAVAVVRSTTGSRSPLTASGVDQSMAVYLTSLALCDLAVLWLGLTRQWLKETFRLDVRLLHLAVCKLHKFLVFALGRMSAWILVAVTSQRVTSVMWPLRQSLRGTKKKAVVTVVAIAVACVLHDVGFLVTSTIVETRPGKMKCTYSRGGGGADDGASLSEFYNEEVYPWLNIVLGSLLPITILVVNNVLLANTVRKASALSRTLTHTTSSSSSSAPTRRRAASVRDKTTSSLTLTLVVTSAAFLLLVSSIPVGFFLKRYYIPTLSADGGRLSATLELVDTVVDLLWYCNSAVNFYLYCLTGTKFRREARRIICLCCCCCSCWGRDNSGKTSDVLPTTTSTTSITRADSTNRY